MADNVVLNPGATGDTIAADDVGGAKFQRIKLIHGAEDSNDGDVSTANPLPVDMREIAGAAVLTGGGVESGALRVTLANDSSGVVSVDDNGANLSVDWGGTVPPIGAGTEAAAATAVLMDTWSAPPEPMTVFRADHPFVFLIRDCRTKIVLFVGRLVNPS